MRKIGFILQLTIAVFVCESCDLPSLRDAQMVVASADSLRAQGQMFGDSLRLAEAFKSLEIYSRNE